jgi:hypothetical protein
MFNSLKADCSRSYILATPPVAEQMPRLAALCAACSTLTPSSCTLHSLLDATSSRSQYLAPCDGGRYYHPKILSEIALELTR